MRIGVNRVKPSGVECARASDDAMHFIPFAKQQFGQIRAVLSSDAGNQRFFSHASGMRFQKFTRDGKSGKAEKREQLATAFPSRPAETDLSPVRRTSQFDQPLIR